MKSHVHLLALALLATSSSAQSIPSDEEFSQWDARYKPGLYQIVEYELTEQGKPKPEGATARQECLQGTNLMFTARATYVAAPMESCNLIDVKLQGRDFAMSYQCGQDAETKGPIAGVIAVRETEPGLFLTSVLKHTVDKGGKPQGKPLLNRGHAHQYAGTCK